ncbi:hypothetical protein FA15DRAFT_681016 [Coprinopsis marcescibilis]|uniref:ATP-dependent DNA helicase n=1 Tax=Coprinopsis marcescibilis TaxID=230819 RepID=A0A5C3KT30_COPMA|nr:hypothetical protein FA15DRAFT_681016 [Coprinopsis marcescibilis]
MNIDDKPFGGLNVILASDFAQLPPTHGSSLYVEVQLKRISRQTNEQQETALGKALWLQFIMVVMLKQNILDSRLHTVLENVRYKACTDEDVAFLRSRIPGPDNDLSLSDPVFQYVSVITAWNIQKDRFNSQNSERFAAQHDTVLQMFNCIDKWPNSAAGRTTSASGFINRQLQRMLWAQPPTFSDKIPASLLLCEGMPVIIRHNVATDLCMTTGQEAVVYAWAARVIPSWPGHKCLDILYVRLLNPPRLIKLPNLPDNVVPVTCHTHHYFCGITPSRWI